MKHSLPNCISEPLQCVHFLILAKLLAQQWRKARPRAELEPRIFPAATSENSTKQSIADADSVAAESESGAAADNVGIEGSSESSESSSDSSDAESSASDDESDASVAEDKAQKSYLEWMNSFQVCSLNIIANKGYQYFSGMLSKSRGHVLPCGWSVTCLV